VRRRCWRIAGARGRRIRLVILSTAAQARGVLAKTGAKEEKPGKGISRLGSKGGARRGNGQDVPRGDDDCGAVTVRESQAGSRRRKVISAKQDLGSRRACSALFLLFSLLLVQGGLPPSWWYSAVSVSTRRAGRLGTRGLGSADDRVTPTISERV
jgi:hypothetical protein